MYVNLKSNFSMRSGVFYYPDVAWIRFEPASAYCRTKLLFCFLLLKFMTLMLKLKVISCKA